MKTCILGGGSWGTALSTVLRHNTEVYLWHRNKEVLKEMEESLENKKYLPGVSLEGVRWLYHLEEISHFDLIVIAVPSSGIANLIGNIKPYVKKTQYIICVTKGLELIGDQIIPITQFIETKLEHPYVFCLSGPNQAEEVGREKMAAAVIGSKDEVIGKKIQKIFTTDYFRIYRHTDVSGIEIGGAYKNIIAIVGGLVSGLDMGINSLSAIVTRSLVEMVRLSKHMGSTGETIYGLSGIGDLMATVFSEDSRNRKVGIELSKGKKLEDILQELGQVAEGVRTTKVVYLYCQKKNIDVPITEMIYGILFENKDVENSFKALMKRPLKSEETI